MVAKRKGAGPSLIRACLVALACVCFGAFVPSARAQAQWLAEAAMPTARDGLAAGVIGQRLYAVGGWDSRSFFNRLEVYDPAGNSWASKSPMPTARWGLSAGVINGELYAVGGYDGVRSLSVLEVYNPATDTWTTKAPMPTARHLSAAGVINGKLYVVGGCSSAIPACVNLEVYDPGTDTWSAKAPMPTSRSGVAAGVIDGKLYVVGGGSGTQRTLNTLEVYDPATDTWATKAPMPTARYHLAAAVLDGQLYALGGYDDSIRATNTVEAYDPATDTWSTKPSLPTTRFAMGAGVVNGVLYAVGGYNGSYLNINEAYLTQPPPTANSLTLLTEENSERAVALDSVTMVRDPFPIRTARNFSPDGYTRIILFAANAALAPGEDASAMSAQAEDSSHRIFPLAVEHVSAVPGFSELTQVTVRLSDDLAGAGDVRVSISLHGATSNKVTIGVGP